MAALLIFGLILGTYQTAEAKFWGREEASLGVQGTPDGSQCFEIIQVDYYVMWIKVDSWVEYNEVPC